MARIPPVDTSVVSDHLISPVLACLVEVVAAPYASAHVTRHHFCPSLSKWTARQETSKHFPVSGQPARTEPRFLGDRGHSTLLLVHFSHCLSSCHPNTRTYTTNVSLCCCYASHNAPKQVKTHIDLTDFGLNTNMTCPPLLALVIPCRCPRPSRWWTLRGISRTVRSMPLTGANPAHLSCVFRKPILLLVCFSCTW